ncbi:MAG TPA: hypothetical protein VK642_03820 [Burkholderiales bacterium]|nr:hypothetical protein [Burkholderiales bacterium]
MIVHVKDYRSVVEFEDADTFTHDEELTAMASELPALERVIASRPMHGLAPILEPDDDYDDFDASVFAERTYQ